MTDIAIDNAGDLAIFNHAFRLVSGIDEIAQRIRIRFYFFIGDWYLNQDVYMPYWDQVFIKNPNLVELDSIFKNVILTTPRVTELLSFNMQILPGRQLRVDFRAETTYGTLSFNELLGILS